MHIERVYIRNYKVFEEMEISFVDAGTGNPYSLVGLTGDNGSGKTTLLDALFTCLTQHPLYAIPAAASKSGSLQSRVEVDLAFNVTEVQALVDAMRGCLEYPPPHMEASRLRRVGASSIQEAGVARHQADGCSGMFSDRGFYNTFSRLDNKVPGGWRVAYIPADRSVPRQKVQQIQAIEGPQTGGLRLFGHDDVKQHLVNLEFLRLKCRETGGPDPFEPYRALTDRLFQGKRLDRVTEDFRVIFRADDGAEIDFDELSHGERALLAIFSSLVRTDLRYCIYLIDEPEQHLHPTWQAHLPVVLADQAERLHSQFILATHSVEVAEGIQKAGGAVYTLSPSHAVQGSPS